MADGRIDTAEAAQVIYGGRGLDDYGNTPPESNSNPSPFGKGTDNDLGRTPQQKAEQGGQRPRSAPIDIEAGRKVPEFDYGALEASGAATEDVDVFKAAAEGLDGAKAEKLVEAHRQISENYWSRQESEGYQQLSEEYGHNLDSASHEVNGVLRQFDPDGELVTMLQKFRMQANPAVFRFLHRIAGHVSKGSSHGR